MEKNELHLKAPGNWINDPNGFIYYKGKYHLFYQHFPYAPVWGTMHWGHAVSDDLIHWEHQAVALFPTKEYDQNGVFSGSALEVDGKLYLYYSAVKYLEKDRENIHMAINDQFETSQAMIISEDGYHFDNWKEKKQIIPVNKDDNQAHPIHTRDPKVWKEGETYYMVLGSTYKEEAGRIVFYTSSDGKNWNFVSQTTDKKFGRIVECPDIFQINGADVFVGSFMGIGQAKEGYENHSVCGLIDFNSKDCAVTFKKDYQYIDYGFDLYAPQTNLDKDGRRVMIAWMRMPKSVKEEKDREWNGIMCQPRVLDVKDGHVYFRVHPEVKKYFNTKIKNLDELNFSKPFCLKVKMKEGKRINIGGYQIWMEGKTVYTDRSVVFSCVAGYPLTGKSPVVPGSCSLDIFVDKNLIEVFINDGEYVISHVVYELNDFIETDCFNEEEVLGYIHQ